MTEKLALVDPTQLAPRDELLRAARAAVRDYDNYSDYETSEKVIAALREAIRRVELEPGPGGWIVWPGGPCPVDQQTIVDIARAGGVIETNVVAGHYIWSHHEVSADRDITSFRIVTGAKS